MRAGHARQRRPRIHSSYAEESFYGVSRMMAQPTCPRHPTQHSLGTHAPRDEYARGEQLVSKPSATRDMAAAKLRAK